MSGKVSGFARRTRRPECTTSNFGTGIAVVREDLLRERLVARQHEATRIAPGVRHEQQLEVAHDVLVELAQPEERLDQVEDDVRLPLLQRFPDRRRARA